MIYYNYRELINIKDSLNKAFHTDLDFTTDTCYH